MGFRRELKDYVGGYYFNENVYWTEDAELTFRIHKTTLSIKRREDAIVVHDPESLPYDLKGAFKIGSGKFSQLVHAGRSWQEESIVTGFKHLLGGKTLRECVQIAQTKSVATAIYALIWKVFYYAGHWYKRLMYACSKPMTLAAASFAAGART
jgi:cellulose synthase/poly-beta-1,6-N-acetylglucosamine synthase-like glycosyltransferase